MGRQLALLICVEKDTETSLIQPGHRLIIVKADPFNAEAARPALRAEITEPHFVRAHFGVPALRRAHRLQIGGEVKRALRLTLDQLKTFGRRELTVTLECAGNNRLDMSPLPPGEPWHEGALSTARWAGVSLAAVLERAGLAPDAVQVAFEGADRGTPDGEGAPHGIAFQRALPIEKALDPDTLLALEMNGAPIPERHGAPLRLIVPGWYGMASVKWLERIEVLRDPFEGWFQDDRYVYAHGDDQPTEPVAEMRCKSIVTRPEPGAILRRGSLPIRGWAWSGSAEVAGVEISIDGSEQWQAAQLDEPLGRYAWRAWKLTCRIEEPGRHTIRARALDAAGNRQPEWCRFNRYGYGNNAVQTLVGEVG